MDNCVVINKNNIKVKVTAKVTINRSNETSDRLFGLLIEKNSYALTYQTLKNLSAKANYQEITCEAIIDVNKNDKIYLDLRSVAAENVSAVCNAGRCITSLIVEEL